MPKLSMTETQFNTLIRKNIEHQEEAINIILMYEKKLSKSSIKMLESMIVSSKAISELLAEKNELLRMQNLLENENNPNNN